MGAGDDQVSQEVMLARMEGKIDVIGERLSRDREDIVDLRARSHIASNRIGVLEAKGHFASGAFKLVQFLAAIGGVGGIAAFIKFIVMAH